MIPRYQRIVYYCFVAGIALLGILLIRGCARDHQRIASMRDQSPITAPSDLPTEQVDLARANDADASVTNEQVSLPLPEEPAQRARLVLERLLADDSTPGSPHPLPPGPAIQDVFLLPLPLTPPGSLSTTPVGLGDAPQSQLQLQRQQTTSPYGLNHPSGSLLAVINLTKTFAAAHPSGIEVEDLTLRSLIATLHNLLPQVDEVQFLIDGQPADTLAGASDLTRPYSVTDPAKSIHVLSPDGNPI